MPRLRCCVITKTGRRCTGGWALREQLIFAWDPIKGVGISGPDLVFCHRHRLWSDRDDKKLRDRIQIVNGWYGYMGHSRGHAVYNTYYRAVFAEQTGDALAPWYLAQQMPTRSGDCQHRDPV